MPVGCAVRRGEPASATKCVAASRARCVLGSAWLGAPVLLTTWIVCACGRSPPTAAMEMAPDSSTSSHGESSSYGSGAVSSATMDSGATGATDTTTDTGSGGGSCSDEPIAKPEVFECSLIEQDCAAERKCMPWANDGGVAWNATRCSCIAAAPRSIGEKCLVAGDAARGLDDCERGGMCWGVEPESGTGTCVRVCGGGTTGADALSECASAETCRVLNEGALAVCVPRCDPFASTCPQGQACLPSEFETQWSCVPLIPDLPRVGAPCEYANVCSPGSLCVETTECLAAASCCTESCSEDGRIGTCPIPDRPCQPWHAPGRGPDGEHGVGSCTSYPLPMQPPRLARTVRVP